MTTATPDTRAGSAPPRATVPSTATSPTTTATATTSGRVPGPRPLASAPKRRAVATLGETPGAIKSEWLKASTIRSSKAILALTIVVNGFVSWALATYVTDVTLDTAAVFTFATVFTSVFAAVAGILVFTAEVQHGSLVPTLTAQSSRSVIAVAKTIIASAYGAMLGAVGLLAGIAGATLAGLALGDTSAMLADGGRAVLFTVLASVLGLGLGLITRHSAAAISGLLVWWLVLENLMSAFVAERFTRFFPFVAGNGILGVSSGSEDAAPVSEVALTMIENGLVFGTYALAALVIGSLIFRTREVA